MSSSNVLARRAFISFLGNISPPIAAFLTGPLLAHSLSVSGRGEVAAAVMPASFAVSVATFGVPDAATYFVARNPLLARWVLRRGLTVVGTATLLGVVVILSLSDWLSAGSPLVARLIAISTATLPFGLFIGVARGIAAAHNRWSLVTSERIASSAARLVPVVILFLSGSLTVTSAVLITLLASCVGGIVYLVAYLRGSRDLSAQHDRGDFRELVKYSSGIWLGSLSGILLSRLDQLLVAPLSGLYQLGLYAVAVSISELPLVLNTAIREAVFTHLSKGGGTSLSTVPQVSRISSLFVGVACVGICILSPLLIPILFGDSFSNSIPAVLILLLAVFVGNPGSMAGVGLSSAGRPDLRSISLLVACISNALIVIALVPLFGALGAAIATLVGNLISSVLNIVLSGRVYNTQIGSFYGFRKNDFCVSLALLRSVTRRARDE